MLYSGDNYKSTLDAAVGYTVSLLPITNSTLQLAVCPFLKYLKSIQFSPVIQAVINILPLSIFFFFTVNDLKTLICDAPLVLWGKMANLFLGKLLLIMHNTFLGINIS